MGSLASERVTHHNWLKARSTGVGASEAAAILGADPYLSPLELWERKTGRVEEPDLSDKEAADLGQRLEPVVADIFCERTGHRVRDLGRHAMLRSEERPHMICTLDRLIEASDENGEGALEIKCTSEYLKDEWEAQATTRSQVQVQHQLYVAGLHWGAVAALVGGNKFRLYPQDRDEEFIRLLVGAVDKFWLHHVKEDVPPSADGTDSAKRALERMYPEDNGTVIDLPKDALDWHQQYEAAKQQEKDAAARKEEAANKIKQAMRSALWGRMPDGNVYKLSTVRRAAYTVPASSYRRLYFAGNKEV